MSMWKKLLVAVAVVAMAIPAFSAVESVKVGGDITVYGIKRANLYDMDGDPGFDDSTDLFQTHMRLFVQAALTDNVEAMVRLINERVWWGSYGEVAWGVDDSQSQICLDLAYIKVSDLLTPGLALTVGRQEIQFGEGLVVGSAYIPYSDYPTGDTWILAQDLGLQKAFDAIRVDYAFSQVPLDITGFMAKIDEEFSDIDWNLYGINLGFNPGDVARVEGYYVRFQDMDDNDANISTLGARVTGDVAGFALKGEYARQFGEFYGDDSEGWALLLGGQYNFPQSEMDAYVKGNLNLFSGSEDYADITEMWISPFASNVASRIGSIAYVILPISPLPLETDLRAINIGGGIRPVEKVGLSLDWYNLTLMESNGDDEVGNEIDATVTYNYTEDLTFGLQYGILLTGDYLEDIAGYDENPWQLIGSMKLAF